MGSISSCTVSGSGTVGRSASITASFTAENPDDTVQDWMTDLRVGGQTIVTKDLTVYPGTNQVSITGSYVPSAPGEKSVDVVVTAERASGGGSVADTLEFVSGRLTDSNIPPGGRTTAKVTVNNPTSSNLFGGFAFYVDGNRQGTSQERITPGNYTFSKGMLAQNLPTGQQMRVEAEVISGDFGNMAHGERRTIGHLTVQAEEGSVCSERGEPCSSNADCCNDLTCFNGECTSFTHESDDSDTDSGGSTDDTTTTSCKGRGEPCSSGECCSGLDCYGGVCRDMDEYLSFSPSRALTRATNRLHAPRRRG